MEEATDWMKGNNSNLKATDHTVEMSLVLTQSFWSFNPIRVHPMFYITVCPKYSKGFDLHTCRSLSRCNFMVIISKASKSKKDCLVCLALREFSPF